MGKLIVLIALVVAVVWLLKRAMAGPPPPARNPGPDGTPQGELVTCAHCGVNLPKSEARHSGGQMFCGEEHARLGPRQP